MKQSNSKTVKKPKIQSLQQKAAQKGNSAEFENQWTFLEDEEDLVTYQHAYEFAPEHRYFN